MENHIGSSTVSRQELYQKIWSTPTTKLAQEFGISDVGLAKVCKRHGIPRPRPGHWAKLAAGKHVTVFPLLPPVDPVLEIITIHRNPDNPQADGEVRQVPIIVVSESLSRPHPLVEATRKYLRTVEKEYKGVLYPDKTCLCIKVSKSSLTRALRIFDAFVKHWVSIGGYVSTIDEYGNSHQTEFRIGSDGVTVELSEEIKRVEVERKSNGGYGGFKDYRYDGTGNLVFKLNRYAARSRWGDGKRQKLEDLLGSFSLALQQSIKDVRENRFDEECKQRQKVAAHAVREKEAKRKELEAIRRKELHDYVQAWKSANEIRAYLADVREKISKETVRIENEDVHSRWIDWASWYADSIDPLIQAPPQSESIDSPTNTLVSDVEVTRRTKTFIASLGASNTDDLFRIGIEESDQKYNSWSNKEWTEICRLLEGLGYDTRERYRE